MLKSLFLGKIIGPIIRHGATAAGVWLVAEGMTDEATAQQIAGGLVAAGSVAMSFAEKLIASRVGIRL
ncbi:hypothetical protein G5B38_02320 [Pseudohalocynthiibacter aestuariivivens]|nr:hypothetical protein [Pseudohalocynthiibacter aestuariivivens]QIE44454.1 hypothetical protein G5B38_02320 [Pseudohalocynthiibacter aestuariivivens]